MSSNTSKLAPTTLPDEEYNRKWAEEGNFQMVRKSHDPRFGEIIIYKRKGANDLIFAKEKLTSSKQSAAADIRELKSRIALNRPGIQRMLGYSTAVKKELCSTNYLTQGFYEFPKSDLSKEIGQKAQSGQSFSENELQQIATQALNGLNSLHQEKITHGDIRPQYLGISHVNGHAEILDRLADPSPLEKTQTSHLVNKKNLYQSPELYKRLQGKDKLVKYDPAKNDLYSLGLSILEAGNGQSIQDIYNSNGTINQPNLDRHIQTFNAKHRGGYLSNLLSNTLNANESQRLTSNELISRLGSGSQSAGDAFGQSQFGNQAQSQIGTAQYGFQGQPGAQQSQFGGQSLYEQTAYTSQAQAQPVQTTTQTTNYNSNYNPAPVATADHINHDQYNNQAFAQASVVSHSQAQDWTSGANKAHQYNQNETSYSNKNNVTNTTSPSFLQQETLEAYNVEASRNEAYNNAFNQPAKNVHSSDASSLLTNATQHAQPATNGNQNYVQQANFQKQPETQIVYSEQQTQPVAQIHTVQPTQTTYTSQHSVPHTYQQPTSVVHNNTQHSAFPATQSYTSYASHPSTIQSYGQPSYTPLTSSTQSFVIPATAPVTTSHTYAVPNNYSTFGSPSPYAGSHVTYSSRPSSTHYVSSLPTTQYVNSLPTTQYVSSHPSQQYVSSLPVGQAHTTTYVSASPTPIGSQTHLFTEATPNYANYTQNQPVIISSAPRYSNIHTSRPLTPAITTHYSGSQVHNIRPLTPTHNRPSQIHSTTYLTSQPNIVTYAQPHHTVTNASPYITYGSHSHSERVVPSSEIITAGGLSGYYQPTNVFQSSRTELLQPLTELRTRKSVSFINHDDSNRGYSNTIGTTTYAKPIESGLSQTYTIGSSGLHSYGTSHRVLGAESNIVSHGISGSHRQTISFDEFQALKNRNPEVKLLNDTQTSTTYHSSHQEPVHTISQGNTYTANQGNVFGSSQNHQNVEYSHVIQDNNNNKHSDNYADSYSHSGSKQIANLVKQADTHNSNTLQNERVISFQNEQGQSHADNQHRQSDEQNYVQEYSYGHDHQTHHATHQADHTGHHFDHQTHHTTHQADHTGHHSDHQNSHQISHQNEPQAHIGSYNAHTEGTSSYDHNAQSERKASGYESNQKNENATKYFSISNQQQQGEGTLSAYGQGNGPRLSYSTHPEQVSQSSRVSKRYRLENGQRIEVTDDNTGSRY